MLTKGLSRLANHFKNTKMNFNQSLLFLFTLFAINSKANTTILYIDSLDQPGQNITISGCDTLMVINNSGFSDYFFLDTTQFGGGDFNSMIYPDLMIGEWGLDTSYFFNINNYAHLFIAHQYHQQFYYINITLCDVSQVNLTLNPGHFLTIYPTVVGSTATISTNIVGRQIILYLYDISGKQVCELGITSNRTFEKNNIQGGMYLYRATVDNRTVKTDRIFFD